MTQKHLRVLGVDSLNNGCKLICKTTQTTN